MTRTSSPKFSPGHVIEGPFPSDQNHDVYVWEEIARTSLDRTVGNTPPNAISACGRLQVTISLSHS